jgi:hypothetical protein
MVRVATARVHNINVLISRGAGGRRGVPRPATIFACKCHKPCEYDFDCLHKYTYLWRVHPLHKVSHYAV